MTTAESAIRGRGAIVKSSRFTPDRLASLLRDRICSDQLEPGDKFLSARQVADFYQVSSTVAHQGMKLLADQKWLETRPRSVAVVGSAVCKSPEFPPQIKAIQIIVGPQSKLGIRLLSQGIMEGLLSTWPGVSVLIHVLSEHGDPVEFTKQIVGQVNARPSIIGVVLIKCPRSVQQLLFSRREIPVVVVGHVDEDLNLPFVDRDQFRIGQIMANHLVERGHQRIGLMMNESWFAGDNLLLSGIQQALAEHGLGADCAAVYSTTFDPARVRVGFEKLCTGSNPVSALVCRSDELAVQCLALAQQREMQVPKDLALASVGYNGRALLETRPTITSMSRSGEELGRLAGELLAQISQGNSTQRVHVEVASELVQRESS